MKVSFVIKTPFKDFIISWSSRFHKKQGKTAYDGLQDLFAEYGTYQEKQSL